MTQNGRLPGSLLAFGVEQEGVRVCLIDQVSGQHRLLGWLGLQSEPEIEAPSLLANACRRLGNRLGRPLWDEKRQQPLLDTEDPLRQPPVEQVAVSLLARPPLRVWLAAVTESLGLATLREIVTEAPANVVGSTVLRADLQSAALAHALRQAAPDVLLIAGGYDDPATVTHSSVQRLCKIVGAAVAEADFPTPPAIFYVGNRHVSTVAALLSQTEQGSHVEMLENIQPAPEQVHPHQLVRALTYYDWRLNTRLPGFGHLTRWVSSPGQVSSLATNFVQLTQLWMEFQSMSLLHGLFCTRDWWLHVLADRFSDGIHIQYTPPQTRLAGSAGWPPAQLISGTWPGWEDKNAPARFWWDREGLAPVIAALGQVAPLAMVQALANDVLLPGVRIQDRRQAGSG